METPECPRQSPFAAALYSSGFIDPSRQQIVKKTLLSSPLVLGIYPLFRVQVNKPFQGLPPESFNDESLQNLMERENDSQRDAFGDDADNDLLFGESAQHSQRREQESRPNPVVREINVLVHLTSLRINGLSFPLKSAVRSSCILRMLPSSMSFGERAMEDSLLISLKSGHLLLVKVFWVPRGYSDSDYSLQNGKIIPDEPTNIYKPFVVQWWRTECSSTSSTIGPTGCSLQAHRQGLLAVSTSQTCSFRIHNVQYTELGMLLQKHHNIASGGIILNSCFAASKLGRQGDHCMFLIMVMMPDERLLLKLYSWKTSLSWNLGVDKSELPLILPAAEEICAPALFIIPLGEVGGFLFVYELKVVIVAIQQIMSADYTFKSIPLPFADSGFPTTYYLLESPVNGGIDQGCDEVHIATDTGFIYTMIISANGASVWRTFCVKDPVSVFAIEKLQSGITLTHSGYNSSCREINIDDEIIAAHEMIPCRDPNIVSVINKFQNWAPIVDIATVKAEKNAASSHELWGIVGTGDSSKLCQFRSGYRATKTGHPHRGFGNSDRLFQVDIGKRLLLFVSLMTATRLLCFENKSRLDVVEVENESFIADERSLLVSTVRNDWGEFILQITPSRILLTNLADAHVQSSMGQDRVLMADVLGDLIAVIVDDNAENKIKMKVFSMEFGTDDDNESDTDGEIKEDFMTIVLNHEFETDSVMSCIKFLRHTHGKFLMTGDFNRGVHIWSVSDSSVEIIETYFLSQAPSELNQQGWNYDHLIPHSACFHDDTLNVGTKDGYLFQFKFSRDKLGLSFIRLLRVGDLPVTFAISKKKKNLLLVNSSISWMIDTLESSFPSQIFFSQSLQQIPLEIVVIPDLLHESSSFIYVALIKEKSLTIFAIKCFLDEAVRRLPIKGLPTRIHFFMDSDVFILLCSTKSPMGRMKLVSRQLLEIVSDVEFKAKDSQPSLFSNDEIPICASLWHVARNEKVSNLVLIGSSLLDGDGLIGSLKVVDIGIFTSRRRPPKAVVTELTSIASVAPISGITQIDSDILLVLGDSIYVTTYDMEEKRLVPMRRLASLPSDICTISVVSDSKLMVLTKLDSLIVFEYSKPGTICSLDVIWSDSSLKQYLSHGQLGTLHVLSQKQRPALSIIREGLVQGNVLQYRIPCLARLYSLSFSRLWAQRNDTDADEDESMSIVCVGVSGDVISFRAVDKWGPSKRNWPPSLSFNTEPIDRFVEEINKLKAPFVNKMSGTGLFSLNRPSFGYNENADTVLDTDVPEIAKMTDFVVGI